VQVVVERPFAADDLRVLRDALEVRRVVAGIAVEAGEVPGQLREIGRASCRERV